MRTIKLVIIGDSGVGKTSLRNQYIMNRFSTGYRATIGTDFITKTVPHYLHPEEEVTLQIWDTAGQERFSSLSTAFFRGADAALLMFDVNRPETLGSLTKWWEQFKAHAPVPDEEAEDFCCVVVGNKIDLVKDEEVQQESNGSASGNGSVHTPRVSEAEAERFLEELVPRTSRSSGDEDDWEDGWEEVDDDPFVANEHDHSRQSTGQFMRRAVSGFSLHSVAPSHLKPKFDESRRGHESGSSPRTRSQSISIQSINGNGNSHPFRRIPRSRSFEGSPLGGTMTTTRTTQTIYHTPSSSLFDAFESAPSSPFHDVHDLTPSSSAGSALGKPATPSNASRSPRRIASVSSLSSAPTITPSLFMRTQASASTSAAPTPPTPIDSSDPDFPLKATRSRSRRRSRSLLPPRPERRPRLFLASAKTGAGVEPVFEHVARRVCMAWTYAEALDARAAAHVRAGDASAAAGTVRLERTSSSVGSLRERIRSGASCCGS